MPREILFSQEQVISVPIIDDDEWEEAEDSPPRKRQQQGHFQRFALGRSVKFFKLFNVDGVFKLFTHILKAACFLVWVVAV